MAQRRGPACCCLERPALASAALLHLSTTTVLAIDDYEMPLSQREQERRTPSKSPMGWTTSSSAARFAGRVEMHRHKRARR